MIDRKWLWAGAAVVLAAALVAGALFTRDRAGESADERTSREGTSTAEATATPPYESPAGTSSVRPSVAGDSTSAVGPGAKPDDRGATAADGVKLKDISTPPGSTLAMVASGAVADGDRFSIAFRPYGWGPDRQGGRGLVIRISGSRPGPGNKSAFKLDSGQNLLVTVSEPVARLITGGGEYNGVVTFRPTQGALAPYLEEARADR